MEAIKLCRLDTPIIFIEARINLSRFVVTGCAAKTSATVTFPSLNLISLFAFCFNIWLNGVAVNIHITIIELNALHTKRQNLFQELDAVIHLLMEAKHWGLRKSRNATSLNSRFKSLDTLKVKIISVTFRRVIRTNHKKASKIWRH